MQVYSSLPDGTYTFLATATDAAGNTAISTLRYSWVLTLPQFAQITGSPAGAALRSAAMAQR